MTRLSEADREKRQKAAAKAYGKGKSIREIASENGWSYGHTHTLLKAGGVSLRPRGGFHR